MKRWSLSHSKDGYAVVVDEIKWWVPAAEWLLVATCAATAHRACSGFKSDIFNRIPVGRAQWEPDPLDSDEPWLVNSVNSKIFDLFQEAHRWVAFHGEKHVTRFPIGEEAARAINPEFASWMSEIDSADDK